MPPSIKLICTDFDGTFFAEFEDPPVPPRLVDQIAAAQADGAKWLINTGRDLSSLLETLGRAHLHIKPDYLVLVEREITRREGSDYVEHKEWNEACHKAHHAIFKQVRANLPKLIGWIHERYDATLYEDYYSPLCLIAENNEDADVIHAHLVEYARSVPHLAVVRNDIYARFSHEDYNKGTALTEVARLLNLGPDQIFAAGDHLNDLPMLDKRHATWLAAPGNAIDSVKAAVREQGGHVSDLLCGHALAEALDKLLGK